MEEKMRIYVGGLGSSVEELDLKKTFTSPLLGAVQSVEIIRTKGRSFAYLDFVPASDKGLAKLFSTYNACLWKGGRLKLEKAKEDYLVRLRREWAEDAQVEVKLFSQKVDEDESVHAMQKPKKDNDIEKLQLKIFFPKLRKIKPIPLKGTGKHKYSFQRVEGPTLPIHFCDCEEHSGPPELPKKNYTDKDEMDNYVVNEDEFNMMKSILSKLLERETRSETVNNEAKVIEEINHEADKWQVDDCGEDRVSDEDNLVINMVGRQSSKRITSFEDWGRKIATADQDSLVRESVSHSNPTSQMHGTKKGKHILDKKRKQSIPENESNDTVPSKKKGKKSGRHDSVDDLDVENTRPIDKESSSMQLSRDAEKSNKSAWKALVSERGSNVFNVSDILTSLNADGDNKRRSDHHAIAPCSNENDGLQDQQSKYRESEKLSDVQSTKTTASVDKSARGASWLQKTSWLQLVGDANTSAFNLAQILPEATCEKQESQQFHEFDFSNLRSGKRHGFVHKDQESPIDHVGEPQGRADTGLYARPGNPSVDVVTKGKNHGAQLNPDWKEMVKEEPSLATSLGADMAPNNKAVGDIVIGETCPFMRTAASMREWVKSKVALSESHKKKGKGKELDQE